MLWYLVGNSNAKSGVIIFLSLEARIFIYRCEVLCTIMDMIQRFLTLNSSKHVEYNNAKNDKLQHYYKKWKIFM